MGNKTNSFVYSVPLGKPEECKGETPVYRAPLAKDGFELPGPSDPKTCKEVYEFSPKRFGSRPFLMWRQPGEGTQLGPYTTMTYSEAFEIASSLGRGILHMGLTEKLKEYKDYELQFIAIHSKNRKEWILIDEACSLFGITTIPIYDTLGPEAVKFVYAQTNLTTLFCTANYFDGVCKEKAAGNTSRLANVVIMDADKPSAKHQEEAAKVGLKVFGFEEVIAAGKGLTTPFHEAKPEDIYTFSYTSGTTGPPKAVMLTHGNFGTILKGFHHGIHFTTEDVHLSYLPLPHVYERCLLLYSVSCGVTYALYNGDVMKLKEDFALVRPTIFPSVPRLFNRFYDVIQAQFSQVTGVKKWLLNKAIETKKENLEDGDYSHKVYDTMVFGKIQGIFGGRVRYMVSASAPISPDIINFFRVAMSCPLVEGYGQTETSGGCFSTDGGDPATGHVGGPLPVVEYKLVDIPDMKYSALDKDENGVPMPRGEICMKGPIVTPGYYKDAEKTAETIDADGWLHTGDVGQILPNGALKIIDRKKNIFKLQQGEYVAPEKIENVLITSPYVAEAFVYGDSLKSYLVGVIVPKPEGLQKLGEANNIQGTTEELAKNETLKPILIKELEKHCKKQGLYGFECLKQVHVEPTSMQNFGILTHTLKLKRHEAKIYYKDTFDKLYAIPVKTD